MAPFSGAPSTALYAEAQLDRRPLFIIPWNGNYLIGTTDIRYEADPGEAKIDEQEIEYLLSETNRLIPKANLTRESILFTYSGVRPLAYSKDQREQSITRRHFIHDHSPRLNGFLSIVGGKLTTYRSLAEEAVNLLFKKLGRPDPGCSTELSPLPGAQIPSEILTGLSDVGSLRERFSRESGLPDFVTRRLVRIYGTRAWKVLQLTKAEPSLHEVFSKETGAIAAEVVFSFQHEMAQTLVDCLLRRTMIGFSATVGIGEDEAVARIAREHLGWSKERAEREVIAYRKYIERFRVESSSEQ